ncbi:hypothetical protein XarbCFBP8150_21875, partial [Xanthomonas arboricola]
GNHERAEVQAGFRGRRHPARIHRHQLALPELPVDLFVESLRQLVAVDASWVPSAPETSLYFRPFMIA